MCFLSLTLKCYPLYKILISSSVILHLLECLFLISDAKVQQIVWAHKYFCDFVIKSGK